MAEGLPKYIADIKTGDSVISHDNSRQKVEHVFEYDTDEELIRIELQDGRVIRATHNHEILINTLDGQKWVKSEELKDGDDIVEVR